MKNFNFYKDSKIKRINAINNWNKVMEDTYINRIDLYKLLKAIELLNQIDYEISASRNLTLEEKNRIYNQ